MMNPLQQLEFYGPERCAEMTQAEAFAWCHRLVRARSENFSVLTSLVPRDRRDSFAALYAFCRWADDLGDESGDRAQALTLLSWWRRELELCFAGTPRHPVFIALEPVVRRHELPMSLFDDLIRAFEQDQRKARYKDWSEVLDYCRLSANPVGRLVLMILGERRDDAHFRHSDQICTALQLTNHWQDIRRDIVERDRIYIPAELNPIRDFEPRFRASAKQGYAIDGTFLGESRTVVRNLVEKTWPLYEEGAALLEMISPDSRPVVWLFMAGGQHVLRRIEMWNYETALHRPVLSGFSRAVLVGRAMWMRARNGLRTEVAA